MRTALGAAPRSTPHVEPQPRGRASEALLRDIVHWLDEAKAEEIVTIDLDGKSSIGDFMVVASGLNDRHVGAVADQLLKKLKEAGVSPLRSEGLESCDWALIDAGEIIIHVFRPEVRDFYNLEKMWSQERPQEAASH